MEETSSALSYGATYYACLIFFSLWMKTFFFTIQVKATEQYFPVVLFITFYKRVLTFESVHKFLLWDLSNYSPFWYCHMVPFLVIVFFFN